jgi:hypothetical protein
MKRISALYHVDEFEEKTDGKENDQPAPVRYERAVKSIE